jgi:hypothetical protein
MDSMMEEDRRHGKKKSATKNLSFILALVFVFSSFYGIVYASAEFTGTFFDYGTDTNGDGLYDYLTIEVDVNVATTGNYVMLGDLYDVNENEIGVAYNITSLTTGNKTIKLYFDGKTIRKNAINGPYYLKYVVFSDENCELLEYIVDAYNTSAYNYLDFQSPLIARFMGKYTDYGTDINGDGLYDYLTIDVGVSVTSAGDYSISGDGKAIQKHGVNGPYYLKNLTFLDENYELLDYIADAYTTSAYNSMDFQNPPAVEFTGIYTDYGIDIDMDGLYDYLTIDVGANVTSAGNYRIEGWLYDVIGSEIVYAISDTYLDIGSQTVELNFDGKEIHEHGVMGTYYLKNLILLDENSIVLDYIVDAYTTAAYNYADFKTPPTQFTDNYFDYGTDIDGDGLYDYLTIDVRVKVTSAGNYNVQGLLYDVDGSIVASTSNDTYLDVGVHSVLLNFDGVKICRHGGNTPFDLSHLILYDENSNLIDYRDFAYTTSAYLYSDFEIGFIGKCADYGIDIDGDGLYEYLTLDVAVNILTAGDYSLMGWLYDANGTEIVWSIDYGLLDVGNRTMHLDFDGETIQTHGVNGPYYLKHLMLSSGENWTFIDYIPEAYTTSAYDYSDFGGFYWTIVEIDIKPGSYPNSIYLKSQREVPVAVLSNGDFDASTVDVSTVVFAGAEPVKWSMEDVDGDGDIDMLFHFKTQELNFG